MEIYLRKLSLCLLKKKAILFSIVSVAYWFAAIGYSFYLGDQLHFPDERWYFNYAQNLVKYHIFSLDGITSTAFNPPGYPIFLSMLIKLGFGIIAARLMNFLAMYLTLVCIIIFLENLSHKLASILAVIFSLGYPVLFYTAGTLYSQTFATLFFILAIQLYWKEPLTTKRSVLSGISLGIAVLTIPTFLFVPFFLVGFSMFFRKMALLKTYLLFMMVFVIIAPWTMRNYQVFNRFQLVSTNFGLNFLIGNSPVTEPNSGTTVYPEIAKIIGPKYLGNNEFENDSFYLQKGLEFIRQNPVHFIALYFQKFANYFNFRNELLTAKEASSMKDLIMAATYEVFLLLAIIRIIFLHRFPLTKLEIFLILLYICNGFVSALTFTRIRFRLPYDYLLIIFVSLFIENFLFTKNRLKEVPN